MGADGPQARSSKVLLVDDSRTTLIAMARVLVGLQTDIHLAQSGEKALEQVDEHDFSVILLDVNMPGMDGMETAARIRERPNGASTPLIFVTGNEEDESTRLDGYGVGAVDYLYKPVKPAVLRTKVDVFLQLDRQRRALERTNQLLEEQRRQLEQLLQTDPTTEVLNRHGFESALTRALADAPARAESSGPRLTSRANAAAVVMFGCDDFGAINSQHGHGVGDATLRTIAARLRTALRPGDSLARVGGDEFLALLPGASLLQATALAERARASVSATPIIAGDGSVDARVSAGVAALPWDTSSLAEVLARARPKLRESKARGKNQVVGAAYPRGGSLVERLVRGEGLRAVGQAIVRFTDREVLGYELFTRGPAGPLATPRDFLELAREQQMLTAIDLRCLKVCLRAASTLPERTLVHVNLFPATLLAVPEREFGRLLELRGGARVCLELSVDRFAGDPRELVARRELLRRAGVTVAIDDVGAGVGSIDGVFLLEPEVVKIDRALVDGASGDARKQQLLHRLVAMSAAFGCELMAEGVERPDDVSLLTSIGITRGQGYLLARPAELSDLLESTALKRRARPG
ncbi:MAG: EAL domain-containing protein [Myxococcales bacterium]|nr:EAL domain-containing protein [Myxococcales bacterium]